MEYEWELLGGGSNNGKKLEEISSETDLHHRSHEIEAYSRLLASAEDRENRLQDDEDFLRGHFWRLPSFLLRQAGIYSNFSAMENKKKHRPTFIFGINALAAKIHFGRKKRFLENKRDGAFTVINFTDRRIDFAYKWKEK